MKILILADIAAGGRHFNAGQIVDDLPDKVAKDLLHLRRAVIHDTDGGPGLAVNRDPKPTNRDTNTFNTQKKGSPV